MSLKTWFRTWFRKKNLYEGLGWLLISFCAITFGIYLPWGMVHSYVPEAKIFSLQIIAQIFAPWAICFVVIFFIMKNKKSEVIVKKTGVAASIMCAAFVITILTFVVKVDAMGPVPQKVLWSGVCTDIRPHSIQLDIGGFATELTAQCGKQRILIANPTDIIAAKFKNPDATVSCVINEENGGKAGCEAK